MGTVRGTWGTGKEAQNKTVRYKCCIGKSPDSAIFCNAEEVHLK